MNFTLFIFIYINLVTFLYFFAVYRQGEIGSSWYAVLGGSLEARLSHTTQTSSNSADKVHYLFSPIL